jgi:hypothetical protein
VYSEVIGNIMVDAMSAKKYYHFIRWVRGMPVAFKQAW